jgi:hypothetical protein
MKRLRTNVRRLFVIAILLFAAPREELLLCGAVLVVIGQIIHFLSAGYLVKKEELITAGPYRFTRNPFYFANLISDCGLCILSANPYVAVIYLTVFYLIIIPARVKKEEAFLLNRFEDSFRTYCKKVPRLIPYKFGAKLDNPSGEFSWHQIIEYREIWRVMRAFGLIIIFYLLYGIKFNIFSLPPQWPLLWSSQINIISLAFLAVIIIVPPIIQFGFLSKKNN